MFTLHIEAETLTELVDKALKTLGIQLSAPNTGALTIPTLKTEAAPAPDVETVPVPDKPAKPRAKKEKADDAEVLQKAFTELVAKNYDAALSILDTLGVQTYKEAVAKGMSDQIKLAMEAF